MSEKKDKNYCFDCNEITKTNPREKGDSYCITCGTLHGSELKWCNGCYDNTIHVFNECKEEGHPLYLES